MTWPQSYWEERKDLPYYQVVKQYLEELGPRESIIDVGCGGCPVATWGNFQQRTAINKENFHPIEGVTSIISDWMDYKVKPVSVITCLQVLEHFEDDYIPAFVDKIFHNCNIAIISVPYEWSKGSCKYHKQDPIDYLKFLSMVGQRQPYRMKITNQRLVAQFNL